MRDKDDVKKLWKLLRKNDPKTRGAAKEALVSIGGPAVPTLVRALTGSDRRFSDGTSWHSKAQRVLYLMGERAVEPLRELTRTGDEDVRRVANEWLAKLAASRPGVAEAVATEDHGTVSRFLAEQVWSATGSSLEEAAKALVNTGRDEAVDVVLARLRRFISFADRLVLVRTLASMAGTGNVRAQSSLDRELTSLKHLMTLDHTFETWMRPGTVHPRLRQEINRLGTLLQAGIGVSSTAEISRDGDRWALKDGNRRYLLEQGQEVKLTTGLSDEVVVAGHEFAVVLPDDHPYLASIHKALRAD